MEALDIHTKHLLIRSICNDDLENLSKLFGDQDVMRFSISGPLSCEKAQHALNDMIDEEKKHGLGVCVILNKQTHEWMGIVGISWIEKKACILYRFFKKYWNQGFATEAVIGFVKYFQECFPDEKIYSYVQKENVGSIRVSEKVKMRFVKKTIFFDEPVLEYVLETYE